MVPDRNMRQTTFLARATARPCVSTHQRRPHHPTLVILRPRVVISRPFPGQVLRTEQLEHYIAPLLDIPHVTSIRLGSKSLAYWSGSGVGDLISSRRRCALRL